MGVGDGSSVGEGGVASVCAGVSVGDNEGVGLGRSVIMVTLPSYPQAESSSAAAIINKKSFVLLVIKPLPQYNTFLYSIGKGSGNVKDGESDMAGKGNFEKRRINQNESISVKQLSGGFA